MELDKFHVRDRRPRPPGHGDAVAGRDVRIGRVQVNLAAPAARQHHPQSAEGLHLARVLVEHVAPQATIFRGKTQLRARDEVHRHVALEDADIRMRGDRLQQRAFDLPPGGILRVEHPALGMAALLAQIQFGRAVAGRDFAFVEVDAQVHQLLDPGRAFADHHPHRCLVTQAGARLERVRDVQREAVLGARDAGHAALRPGGVRVGRGAFGDDGHVAECRGLQRETQPRHAAADDDKIEALH